MSVTTQTSRFQYACNGSAVSFAFPALIYNASELVVAGLDFTTGVTTYYVLNTDYTIDPSLIGQDSGVNVVFGSAPANTVTLTIARQVPATQVLELVEGAKLPSVALEQVLDELEFQIQQINDALGRLGLPPITQTIGNPLRLQSGDYVLYDVSANGVPMASVTLGNHRDSTGNAIWVPTLGGTLLSHIPAPSVVVGESDTVCYFHAGINQTTGGFQTTFEVLFGTSVPSDTETDSYQLLTNILVTVSDGVASITNLGGGVSGSQNYFYCGVLPPVDGTGHIYNS